jgi:hypothetical protein
VPDIHVDSADTAFVSRIPAHWATGHHVGDNERVAKAYVAWKHAKGI